MEEMYIYNYIFTEEEKQKSLESAIYMYAQD